MTRLWNVRAILSDCFLELFQSNVSVGSFRGGAAVDLQADDSLSSDLVVGLRIVDRLQTVHPDLNPRPLAANHQVVIRAIHTGRASGRDQRQYWDHHLPDRRP